jgi:hypothetical protein
MIVFNDTPYVKINPPNGGNPDNVIDKIVTSKLNGEVFKYVWDNGWEIYEAAGWQK